MSSFITPIGTQDVRTTSTVSGGVVLGALGGTADGRIYRWSRAGAVDLAPGKLSVTPARVTNHANRTLATGSAVGSFTVSVPVGATAVTQDQYKDGFLTVNDGTAEGITYLVEGNTSASSSGTTVVSLKDPIKVALTSGSDVTLDVNPCDALIIAPGAVAHQAQGVNNVTISASTYGWVQVNGYCSVLSDGIVTKGAGAIISDAVNGAVEVEVAGTVTQRVATAVEASVDTEYSLFNLCLL